MLPGNILWDTTYPSCLPCLWSADPGEHTAGVSGASAPEAEVSEGLEEEVSVGAVEAVSAEAALREAGEPMGKNP